MLEERTVVEGEKLDFEAYAVKKADVYVVWPYIRSWVKEALNRSKGEYWPEDLLKYLSDGTAQLLIVVQGGEVVFHVITEVVDYPRKRYLNVLSMGGERQGHRYAQYVIDMLEVGARRVKADAITGYNWPTMARLVRRYGWNLWYTVVGKEVGNESLH